MNLFSPILRLFGLGAVSNKDEGEQHGGTASRSTDAGITVTDERALQVSTVWACIDKITSSIVSLPLNVYERGSDGARKQVTDFDNPLVNLLQVRPNKLMKPRDFRKAMTLQLVNWCNAYAEIFWNDTGTRPLAIVPLKPGRMTPVITRDGDIIYNYQMEQGVRVLSKKSVLHLKGMSTEGIVGLERASFARQALGIAVSADVYASRQFASGGRPGGGFLMFDTFLTQEQRKQARELYEGMTETAFNKGKVWILEGGVKYEPDTVNPDTMQMIETRKMQVAEIARFYGVPEILVGGGGQSSAWPASFEQQLLSFLTFTLQDYIDEWESAIHYSLLPTYQDRNKYFVDHDVSGFIKMDSQSKAQVQSTWVQNGLKTRNEIRHINNDPPLPGGDDLTVQVNLTPVEALERIAGAKRDDA